ncbi:hypothetical protein I7I53_10385 [Histoplasma capsulatum var. duboisii H88]|uniref:Uncharacterized protein n=1 Tax=Ajellomyces capsulatus (strain H88) TaxID=544711 RepID=A0A8A1L7E1_AJEC8|nr:hypothetical protein I7I53_10385 [Histoplasma capsulatum var. duboisii H88]
MQQYFQEHTPSDARLPFSMLTYSLHCGLVFLIIPLSWVFKICWRIPMRPAIPYSYCIVRNP